MIQSMIRRENMAKEEKNLSGFVHFLLGEREVEENEVQEGWRWKRIEEKEEQKSNESSR